MLEDVNTPLLAHSSTLLSQHGAARWQLLKSKTALEQHKRFLKQRGTKPSSPLTPPQELIQIRKRQTEPSLFRCLSLNDHQWHFFVVWCTKVISVDRNSQKDLGWLTKSRAGTCKHTFILTHQHKKTKISQLPDFKA